MYFKIDIDSHSPHTRVVVLGDGEDFPDQFPHGLVDVHVVLGRGGEPPDEPMLGAELHEGSRREREREIGWEIGKER